MTIRRKRNILIFIIYPLSTASVVFLAFLIHDAIVLLVFPLVFLVYILAVRMRCPNCGTPVGWHEYKIGEFSFITPFTPKHCKHCDYSFDKGGTKKGGEMGSGLD
jgi:hypothetical protein